MKKEEEKEKEREIILMSRDSWFEVEMVGLVASRPTRDDQNKRQKKKRNVIITYVFTSYMQRIYMVTVYTHTMLIKDKNEDAVNYRIDIIGEGESMLHVRTYNDTYNAVS